MTISRNLNQKVDESVRRTLVELSAQIDALRNEIVTLKSSSNGNVPLSPVQIQQVTGLIAGRSQSVIGIDIADPVLPGQVGATGTVSSVNGTGDTNISVTGAPITGSGSLAITISANPSFTTVNVITSFKVGGTKVVGARGAAVADVASVDATDLPSAITLANETKAQLNSWLARARATTGHGLIS